MTFIPKDQVDKYLTEKRIEQPNRGAVNNPVSGSSRYENQDDIMAKIRNLVGRDYFVMSSMKDLLDLNMLLEIMKDNPELRRKLENEGITQDTLIENLRRQVGGKSYHTRESYHAQLTEE